MANKYYDLLMSGNVSKSIISERLKDASFEDHFWHMACLAKYYENTKAEHLEKSCLRNLCDLNYAYTAMLFFLKYDVLPEKYKQYTLPFEHAMKNEVSESRIAYYNKKNKSGNLKNFLLYALSSLVIVPLMLLLVLVFKVETNIATIVCVVYLLVSQFFLNPMYQNKKKYKQMLETNQTIDNNLKNYLSYYDRFALLFQNDLYMDLIKAKNEEKRLEVVKKIKENKN